MARIFLDANIIFSGIKSEGAVRQVLRLLTDSSHDLIADAYVLEEAERNIEAKYPASRVSQPEVVKMIRVLPLVGQNSLPPELQLAEKDKPVLAAAVAHQCHFLITGDKTHFGHLYGRTIGGVTILSPRSAAELLLY